MSHFDLIDWDVVALEVIKTRRGPVYPKSQLSERKSGKPRKAGVRGPDLERHDRVREGVRSLYEQISRYYWLPAYEEVWVVTALLEEGRRGIGHWMSWRVRSPSFSCSGE